MFNSRPLPQTPDMPSMPMPKAHGRACHMSPHRWYRFTGHKLEVTFVSAFFLPIFGNSKIPKKIQNSPAKARLAFANRAGHFSPTNHLRWWLNQPIWKICSSNQIISPIFGVKIPKIFELPPPGVIFEFFGGGMKVKFYSPVAVSCCSLPRTWDIGEFPSPKAPANRLEMFPSQSNPPQERIEAVASQTSFVSSTKGTNM